MKTLVKMMGSVAFCLCATSCMAQALSAKQQSVISIAAYTASGQMALLRTELTKGLENGLTVNEIKEILVQLYAYTGFPRSLNGIHAFMNLIKERELAGIKDPVGKESSELPKNLNKDEYGARVRATLADQTEIPAPAGYQLFTPAIDSFLKEHLFCDIFARDGIDYQSRELATIGALAAMSGTAGQMRFHFNAAMNTGTSPEAMQQFIQLIGEKMGTSYEKVASDVLSEVLLNRQSLSK